jgi:hypothetical protein
LGNCQPFKVRCASAGNAEKIKPLIGWHSDSSGAASGWLLRLGRLLHCLDLPSGFAEKVEHHADNYDDDHDPYDDPLKWIGECHADKNLG